MLKISKKRTYLNVAAFTFTICSLWSVMNIPAFLYVWIAPKMCVWALFQCMRGTAVVIWADKIKICISLFSTPFCFTVVPVCMCAGAAQVHSETQAQRTTLPNISYCLAFWNQQGFIDMFPLLAALTLKNMYTLFVCWRVCLSWYHISSQLPFCCCICGH